MNSIIKLDKDIIQKYKPLIYKIANKIYRQVDGDIYEDLIQTGYETLLKAYHKYNKDKGSLCNYLTTVLTRSIRQEFNLQKNIVTIPRNIMDYTNHLYEAKKRYNNKEDIIKHILDNSTLTVGRANSLYHYIEIAQPVLLDENILDTFNNYNSSIDNILDTKKIIQLINNQIQYLNKVEQKIINLHYIDNNLTLKEIAKLIGISEVICWSTHTRTLKKLRKRILSKLKRKED